MYLLNMIVWGMMNPCCLGFVGLACGWVLVCRGEAMKTSSFRKAGRWIIGGAILWMWFWSSGVPFWWWQKGVAREFPPRVAAEYPMADAIVDLGSGMGTRDFELLDLLPSAGGFMWNNVFLHEVIGYWWYRIFR